MPAPPRIYRPDVDGLRAVAVAAVIANHFSSALLPGGYLGVDIFFVISGYVISASLATETHRSPREFLTQFYARRIKRLLPALVVCVVITAIVASAFIEPVTRDYSRIINSGTWALFGASNIYFFLKATDYFAASTELNPFTHTWSLGVEEQFYLVFPAMLLLLAAGSRRGFGALSLAAFTLLLAISLGAYLWLIGPQPHVAYFLMPMRFWELGIGYLAYRVCSAQSPGAGLQREWVSWTAAIVLVASLSMPLAYQREATVLAVACSALLIVSLRPGLRLHGALTLQPLVWIGLISYSLYLWHWSILSLSRWTIGVTLWTAPLQLILMFALATLSYALVERPLRYRAWSLTPLKTIGYGLAVSAVACLSLVALRHPLRGKLYTGEPASMAELGGGALDSERWKDGKPLWHAGDCILSSNSHVGKAIDPERCALGERREASDRLFMVIGNSFSAAEIDLVDVLRERNDGAVILTSSWDASPVPEIPNSTQWSEANAYYWRTVVPSLSRMLQRGDFLVMINDVSLLTPRNPGPDDAARLHMLSRGLIRIIEEMRARGVSVIFQTAIPYMRDARCTPSMAKKQWFNVSEPAVCHYYSKADTLVRRQPLTDTLAGIERTYTNFHVLDLLPVLCPGEVCRMRNDSGTFLYRDISSHLSIDASRLARPILIDLVKRASARIVQSAKD